MGENPTFMKNPNNNLNKIIGFPLQFSLSAEWMELCGRAEGWMFKGPWEVDGKT